MTGDSGEDDIGLAADSFEFEDTLVPSDDTNDAAFTLASDNYCPLDPQEADGILHSDGAEGILMADGSVRFINDLIDAG